MKTIFALTVISIVAGGLLGVCYWRSTSRLFMGNEAMLHRISELKHADMVLERDVLLVKDLRLLDYDAIIENELALENFCSEPVKPRLRQILGPDFDKSMAAYCAAVERKVQAIDIFKARASVYRAALLFVRHAAAELQDGSAPSSLQRPLVRQLVRLTVNYALLPDAATRATLARNLTQAETEVPAGEQEALALVAQCRRVFETKPSLEKMVDEILESNTQALSDNMQHAYMEGFDDEEYTAEMFRRLLFGAGVLMTTMIVLSLVSLRRSSLALEHANANLESRVLERTRELLTAQRTVTDQQHQLLAAAKMSALGEMAGGMAHEINTPLATIQLRTEQLMEFVDDGLTDKALYHEALTSIEITVRRIATIVKGLRNFARDGRRDPMISYSLQQIVNDTFGLCRERFQNHGVSLESTMPEINVLCRPTEMSQVLLNLLNNSFDAVQEQTLKWIRIEGEVQGDNAVLRVIDCGHGIPEEVQHKMLQPFFTTKEPGKGTGLGLSISKGIIESHGGNIYVDRAHKNTCFTVTLPLTARAPLSATA